MNSWESGFTVMSGIWTAGGKVTSMRITAPTSSAVRILWRCSAVGCTGRWLEQGRIDFAGVDRRHADTIRVIFVGDRGPESGDGKFGGGISDPAERGGAKPGDRGNVDDQS